MMQLQNALFVQLFDFIPMKKKERGGRGGTHRNRGCIETKAVNVQEFQHWAIEFYHKKVVSLDIGKR